MNIGDTVMFTNEASPYAKWFYSQIGIVKSMKNGHCRVTWLQPVAYHNGYTRQSDFELTNFTTFSQQGE